MAERDEAMHYLLNKLKSEDGWSGSNLAWNDDTLALISGQFSSFDSSAKVKVLLSFIGMTPRTISQVSAVCLIVTSVSPFLGMFIFLVLNRGPAGSDAWSCINVIYIVYVATRI